MGYGIKKLQINCVVEDDKVRAKNLVGFFRVQMWSKTTKSPSLCLQVGTDILEEQITAFEDFVQSMDVAAFNKI